MSNANRTAPEAAKRFSVRSPEGTETDASNRLDLAILAADCNAIAGSRVVDTSTGETVYEIPRWNASASGKDGRSRGL